MYWYAVGFDAQCSMSQAANTPPPLYIGLMSGTSLDGIDGVLADFSHDKPHTLAFASEPFDADIREELLALQAPCANELERAMLASNVLAEGYAVVVHELLQRAKLNASNIIALGAHGQTVRHQPRAKPSGYTVQLLNAALLTERTGIATVHNFRARDIAAGGQGAPLVPAFHAALFATSGETQVVANLGGIANITVLGAKGEVAGFDTGPGNCLMDAWAALHLGTPYDAHGEFAAKGKVNAALLAELIAEPYFYAPPPKSTGRDLFHAGWLQDKLQAHGLLKPADVQATLTELTARSIADAVKEHASQAKAVWLCGGGAFNRQLVARLAHHLPACKVGTTAERGVPELHVEALAFAWLAKQHVERKAVNLSAVTGALRGNIFGQYTPT
jgi:anhydro-N-acetylmuramic acid kinase